MPTGLSDEDESLRALDVALDAGVDLLKGSGLPSGLHQRRGYAAITERLAGYGLDSDGLDVVAVRIQEVRRVIARVVLLSDAGRAVVARAGGEGVAVKRIDRRSSRGAEGEVHAASWRASLPEPEPRIGTCRPEADLLGTVVLDSQVQGAERSLVNRAASLEISDVEKNVFEHAQDRRQRTSASVYGFATRHYKSHLSSEPQRCVRRSAATSPEPKKARPERLVLYERLAELVLAAFSWRRSCWRSSRVIRERLIIERLQLWSKVLDADQPLSRIVSAASFVENFTEQGFQSEVFLDWLRFRSTLGSRRRHDLS